MKKLLCLMGAALLISHSFAQSDDEDRGKLYIDSRLPNINLGRLINYKDSTASLSTFKNKIIILDFWFTACGACIAQFPKEELLQKEFGADIQIIPVAYESEKDVRAFMKRWSKINKATFTLPFIVGDTLLNTLFANVYYPHYIWIAQDGQIIAHTSQAFLTAENVKAVLRETAPIKAALKKVPGSPDSGMEIKDLYPYYFNQKTEQ